MEGTEQRRTTLSNDLARSVVSMVNDRDLQPGDPLDSLKSLASRFDVAVPTMREALRRLEGLGVLEFRHGSGIYVGNKARRRVLSNPLVPKPDKKQLLELLEARRQIEPQLARYGAEVRDVEGLRWLTETHAKARIKVAERDQTLWLTNLDFHRAVAATSGNAILGEVLDSILLVHGDHQKEILRLHGDAVDDFRQHTQIAEAIRAGEPDRAYFLSKEHLDHVISVITKRF